jgi:membrane-associated phospholipid phosphatase
MKLKMSKPTYNKAATVLPILFMAVVCIYMISHRIWFSPDQFFIFALVGVIFIGRTKLFILDWGPFMLLYLSYEFLRGLVPFISNRVNIFPTIHLDQKIFGFIPSVKLQSLLYTPPNIHWYDYVAVTLYICHFVTPMIVAFIFWMKDRQIFKRYTLALLILSYAAFLTYIVYPAMPPWMASSYGYIPPIKEVTGVVMSHFFTTPFYLPSLYSIMDANPVAAMPSLHSAFPTLVLLYLIRKYKAAGLLFLPYAAGVWFAVIYLGEHYFTDVIAGIIYAVVTFVVVEWGLQKIYTSIPNLGIFEKIIASRQ